VQLGKHRVDKFAELSFNRRHPSIHGGRAKEGLSLFHLMDRTASVVGRKKLR
jgi:hypothetical protein